MYPFSSRSPQSFPLLAEAEERFAAEKHSTPLAAILTFLFKRSARHLKAHLATQHGVTLSHGQALDAISASVGCANWNTANALLQQVPDAAAASPAPAWHSRAQPSQKVGPLSRMLDFTESSLVVGPSGCGKSCGLLFALQNTQALARGRPVLVVRASESLRYQPNWNGALWHFENVKTLKSLDSAPPTAQDKLDYWVPDTLEQGQSREAYQKEALASLVAWLQQRAKFKPLVLVEEAYYALGALAPAFLSAIPKEATVIWTTQTLQDIPDTVPIARYFSRLYLMQGSARTSAARLEQVVGSSEAWQVLATVEGLTQGSATWVRPPVMVLTQDQRTALLKAFMAALERVTLAAESQPRHKAPSAWLMGTWLCVQEIKLREHLVEALDNETYETLQGLARPTPRLNGVTTALLELLDSTDSLVHTCADVNVPRYEALWDISAGGMTHMGVLIVKLPVTLVQKMAEGLDGLVSPSVKGPTFDPARPGAQLGNLLRTASTS